MDAVQDLERQRYDCDAGIWGCRALRRLVSHPL